MFDGGPANATMLPIGAELSGAAMMVTPMKVIQQGVACESGSVLDGHAGANADSSCQRHPLHQPLRRRVRRDPPLAFLASRLRTQGTPIESWKLLLATDRKRVD